MTLDTKQAGATLLVKAGSFTSPCLAAVIEEAVDWLRSRRYAQVLIRRSGEDIMLEKSETNRRKL